MAIFIGYDFYGVKEFKPSSPPVRNINKSTFEGAVIDEISVRESISVDTTSSRDGWFADTRMIAKFLNDLEAGNISNNGLEIVKFAIKRRRADELNSVTLGYRDFVNDSKIIFADYTQPNDNKLIYSIVPIASNGLDGRPHEVQIDSDFVGWWVVDKDTNTTLGFDTFMDSEPEISTQLTQGRTVIETLSRFPQVYYDERDYHNFSLNALLVPSEFERSGKKFEEIVNHFVRSHKPFLVKSSDGRMFVCDINNPQFSVPMNTWKERDYGQITLDFTEVMDYESFINE